MHPRADPRRRAGLRAAAIVAAVGAAGALWWSLGAPVPPFVDRLLSVAAIEATIRSWGAWGVAGSIGLMVAHSFLPFPAGVLALANGMVYGPYWGALITWTGAMLGAFLAFGLARWLGRPFVRRVVRRRHRQAIDRWSRAQGGGALLAARLVPLIAFNLINYAAGLTALSWWTFAWATALGILPLTLLLSFAGAHMTALAWWVWPAMAVAALAVWLAWRRIAPATEADGPG